LMSRSCSWTSPTRPSNQMRGLGILQARPRPRPPCRRAPPWRRWWCSVRWGARARARRRP
jgi:hypothetical protein